MGIITDKEMGRRPADKDLWLVEDGARGTGRFVGRITPAGARTFYYRYTDSSGQRDRLPIGPFDGKGDGRSTYTVQQARDRARELSALYRSGIKDLRKHFAQLEADARQNEQDQRELLETQRQAVAAEKARNLSLRQVFERWCSTELQPSVRADGKRTGRKDSGAYVRAQFERHVFPLIGDTPIRELRKAALLSVIDAQKAKGKLRTASVLLSDLRQMMAYALDRELIDADPLGNVKKARIVGVAVERERVLSKDEIRLLANALPQARMNMRSESAIWLLLATGARIGELMGAVWAESLNTAQRQSPTYLQELQSLAVNDGVKVGTVDLAARQWHLPDTKNQRAHTIHLSDFAVEHFERLRQLQVSPDNLNRTSPWVFPARNPLRPVCVKSFGKQIADRQRTSGKRLTGRSLNTDALALPGGRWTAHDLRRTAGTLMASLGVSGDVIDEALNHIIESRVRRTYVRDRREPEQAQALNALGELLKDLSKAASA
jgi:integrase